MTREQRAATPLRIAMVAPPWIPVPPPGYGGIETVVSALTEELVGRGHEVTLYCAPGSMSAATLHPLLAATHEREIERAVVEADHVSRALADIEPAGDGPGAFDVIHDHSGFTLLAMANRLEAPVVHTVHGPLDHTTAPFYAEHAGKATLVGISRAQLADAPADLVGAPVIANPIDLRTWRMHTGDDGYVLWVGRITPDKGPDRAIDAARRAGVPIVLAGVVQPSDQAYFERAVAPQVDGTAVRFVGEVSGASKRELFGHARALLMPIRWPEPFGMVMIEALASGTPVIAFPEGAARELVVDGVNGFLVDDEAEMAAGIAAVASLAPAACRRSVADRCDVRVVTSAYEAVYASAIRRAIPGLLHA